MCFIDAPSTKKQISFSLIFNYLLKGEMKTVTIDNCVIKFEPVSATAKISYNAGTHGEIHGTHFLTKTIPAGIKWGTIAKPPMEVEGGWTLDHWEDGQGNTIKDDDAISEDLSATAIYKTNPIYSDSWENFCTYANQGLNALKTHYQVSTLIGLERPITLNGYTHTVRVIGEEHDDLADGTGKATLTFELVTLLSNNVGMQISSTIGDDAHDYRNSKLRKNLTGEGTATGEGVWTTPALTLFQTGNPDLYANLKTVTKTTSINTSGEVGPENWTTTTYDDKLFVLTYTEMGGTDTNIANIEGKPYEYWSNHFDCYSRIKYDAAYANYLTYWLSSPCIKKSQYITEINQQMAIDQPGKFLNNNATGPNPVSFAFCI